jgi:hypothetical protein
MRLLIERHESLPFHLLHDADEWTGCDGRLLVCCRKPPGRAPAVS